MIECRSLIEYLEKSKISGQELENYVRELCETKDDELERVIKKQLSEVYIIEKGKVNSRLQYESKINSILERYDNRWFEGYSIAFSEKVYDNAYNDHRLFYRGAYKTKYKLIPGIYRTEEKKNENYYYHELQVRCPNDLAHLKHFNKLTYMQHYGAPTRLLDITANPLVALYFACEKKNDDGDNFDGKVSVFCINKDELKYEASNRVQMLSHLQELNKNDQEWLLQLSYAYLFKGRFFKQTNAQYYDKVLEKFYYDIHKENPAFDRKIVPLDLLKPIFVQPNQDNPRILKQDGAFIMSGLDMNEKDSNDKISKYVIKELLIPKECKANIREELRILCIHKASLFPELETVAQFVKEN